ncbi:MAG: glycosylhydrolase-like jelly roll fold domain-containing protein [Cyclobacteriaceae bacterium]
MRLPVLKKALKLVQDGGTVIFYGQLPTASVENGRDDYILKTLLEELFKTSFHVENMKRLSAIHENGGYVAFLPEETALIPSFLSAHIDRDFISTGGDVFISHRKAGENHIYFIQNVEDKPVPLNARLRADGVPEIWDPFTGEIQELDQFERKDEYTHIQLLLEGNIGSFIILNPLKPTLKKEPRKADRWQNKKIADTWDFSVIATRDNQWGDFEWPPSDEKIGPEIRGFKYREENGIDGIAQGWHLSGLNDLDWKKVTYDQGPYWLVAEEIPASADVIPNLLVEQNNIEAGKNISADEIKVQWREITFSQKTGTGTPAPWGGHSGYPDGHYNKNFLHLREGRKILFTRIYSPEKQQVGLNVQLRNQEPELWVNGEQQQFTGAVGNLPLKKGYNHVLLDVSDGTGGMLYVQEEPPVVSLIDHSALKNERSDLKNAFWIWAGNSEGTYFRKIFDLKKLPKSAKVLVTGVSGFRLFINGNKVTEDIGPWASWEYPKSVDITPWLKNGKNLIAAWGQFLKGMHVSYPNEFQGFILSMKAVYDDRTLYEINTNDSWKGHTEEIKNWHMLDFDDSDWQQAEVKGEAGDEPWGDDFMKNAGSSTTPYRPLSVHLETPLLEVFNEMPEIYYDIKTASDNRRAWYRFEVPPGLKEMKIPNNEASVWVNGREVPVNYNGLIQLKNPPIGVSMVAIRLKMKRGQYAGAAFEEPIKLKIQGGKIKEGLWQDFALPTYSGIGVYKQNINFNEEEVNQEVVMDLGEVYVAAEVLVDGKSVGIKVAAPFTFDISPFIRKGNNEIEVRVANTLAPHYSFPSRTTNLGPVESGLVGPVQLKIYR